MKKFLIALLSIVAALLLALLTLPFLFKDKIKAAVDDAINNNVNAKVYFAADKFDLTFFKKFPNLSVTLGDFGVVGVNEFDGDTLADVKSFNLTIDVFSLMGDKIKIKGITLDSPTIHVIVLKDGKANWDIAKPSTDTSKATPEEPGKKSTFALGIDSWEIKNGNVIYDDRKTPQLAKIENLNHKGKGDITQDVYDISTFTTIDYLTYELDSVAYMTKKRIEADFTLVMDNPNSKYTFKDNKFKINDFEFGFNGFLTMPAEGMYVDMTFQSRETAFKNILSLVPGIYTESYKDLKAEGTFAFDGFAKGWKKENVLPAFGLNVKIDKGMFQYPSLPTSVSNVLLDMNVANADGIIDNTVIDIKKFHLELGKNPVDAKMKIAGLTDYLLDGEVRAKVDLAEVSSIFPMNGLNLKGLLGLNVLAKGTYSKAKKLMPTIQAGVTLTNGFVKSDKFPAPIEKIELAAQAQNPTGQLNDTKVDVSKLNFELDGEPFATTMAFSNFSDLIYDVKAKGIINLDKMTKIYPLDGMSLSGIINANIETKGKLSDVQSGKYINCPTSGTLGFKNFVYVSPSLKQGFKMTDANVHYFIKAVTLNGLNYRLFKPDTAEMPSVSVTFHD
ncbi:MAG: AsmA family protein, partial [Cytophagales bacterium]|nr:AsmA family protein [Cytophagales bacterium]